MINIHVTSESSREELELAKRFIGYLIDMHVQPIQHSHKGETPVFTETITFNAAELAEAESLGKPVASIVDVSQSTIAPVDTAVNTSTPTPQSVFGQAAQTTENVVNPVAQTTETPALDADGLPWDERIHSSSKECVKDGTWRKKRGVADSLVKVVEAELRGTPEPTLTVPTELTAVTAVTAPAPAPEMTFSQLLDGVTKALIAGELTQVKINEALDSVGMAALPHLISHTNLIPAFRTALGGVV